MARRQRLNRIGNGSALLALELAGKRYGYRVKVIRIPRYREGKLTV